MNIGISNGGGVNNHLLTPSEKKKSTNFSNHNFPLVSVHLIRLSMPVIVIVWHLQNWLKTNGKMREGVALTHDFEDIEGISKKTSRIFSKLELISKMGQSSIKKKA